MNKRKIIVATAVVAIGIGAGTASAAQPVAQGCVGESVSANAQAFQPYGQAVLAPNAPAGPFGKISDAVHSLQAGDLPNEAFPNTCG